MNKDVKVESLTMQATTSDGLEISLGDLNESGVPQTITTEGNTKGQILAPSKLDKSWKTSILMSDYYKEVGELMPASSATGSSIYYVDTAGVFAGGTDVEEHTNVLQAAYALQNTTASEGANNAALILATTSSNSSLGTESNDSYKGYYIDVPMWIRTNASTSENSGTKVYCSVKITDPDTSNGSDLINAVRVAIIPMGSDGTIGVTATSATEDATNNTGITDSAALTAASGSSINIFGLTNTAYNSTNKAINSASTKSGSGESITGGYTDSILAEQTVVSALKSETSNGTATVSAALSGGNTETEVFTIPDAESNDYGQVAFIARVWLEGESTYCNDATADQDWRIDFYFSSTSGNAAAMAGVVSTGG